MAGTFSNLHLVEISFNTCSLLVRDGRDHSVVGNARFIKFIFLGSSMLVFDVEFLILYHLRVHSCRVCGGCDIVVKISQNEGIIAEVINLLLYLTTQFCGF